LGQTLSRALRFPGFLTLLNLTIRCPQIIF
jgi:hypothetical protein